MKIEKDKYYLIRTEDTSVYFGRITEKAGQEVTMTECRCIWYWSGAASLNQLANEGVKNPDDCKFTVTVDSLTALGVVEILLCTHDAVNNIKAVKEWRC